MVFRWTIIFTAVAALGTVGITTLPALAQWGRAVNVNGQWLNPQQIFEADQIAGFHLPNGYYWYDPTTCVWGVVGNTSPIGRAPCGRGGGGVAGGRGQMYETAPGGGEIYETAPFVVCPPPCLRR